MDGTSQGQTLVCSRWPQHLAQWVLVFWRTPGCPKWFWCHFSVTSARWRCSPQECCSLVPWKSTGPIVGVVASGEAGRSLGQTCRKSTSFHFLLICSVWNAARIESFIFPISWSLGRQRPLCSSLLCCLIAGEFRSFLSPAFRLFQAYCPMYVQCWFLPWVVFTYSSEQKRGKIQFSISW